MTHTKNRPQSFLVSIYVLFSLIGFSSLLLIWSYDSSIKALDKEQANAFEQRLTIGEIILSNQMELVDMALKEILTYPNLMDAVSKTDSKLAQTLLLSAIDANTNFYLDIGFISLPNQPVWVDAGSSLFDSGQFLPDLVKTAIPDTGMIYHFKKPTAALTMAVKALPIVNPVTGKLLGQFLGGFILDNNQELLEEIQNRTQSKTIAFFAGNEIIGSSPPMKKDWSHSLIKARQTTSPGERFFPKDSIASYRIFGLAGNQTPLEVMVVISNTAYSDLKKSYQIKTLIMFFLALIFSLFSVWVIRRLTHPSLSKLMDYSRQITSGQTQVSYQPGNISELNQVGHAMETMVSSLAEANQQMASLQNYLSDIIDSMPSILVGIDMKGRVTQWNKGAVAATGITSDQALTRPLKMVFPRLSREMIRVEAAIESRQPHTLHRSRYRKEDQIGFENITIYPLTAKGIQGAVLRIDDVTNKVHMEEMMIQSEKMLSVGGLAAGMAHEINNPLAGMIQNADLMQKRLTLDLPANLKTAEKLGTDMKTIRAFMEERRIPKLLTTIHTSGMKAAEIITNMLSFARAGNSSMLPNNLLDLMEETLALAGSDYNLKKQYDFREIIFRKVYNKNMPLIPCEPGKIQQVFLNILTNGAQAMYGFKSTEPLGYTPEFRISIQPEPDLGMACITIQDNGPGMDEKVQKRIFEPFFTTKSQGEGTGLGLSVSYFIIRENHNGQMEVFSPPGQGTRFIIRLPLELP